MLVISIVCLLFCFPGYCLFHLLFGRNEDILIRLSFSVTIGISVSSFIAASFAYFFVWNPFLILSVVLLIGFILLFAEHKINNERTNSKLAVLATTEWISLIAVCLISMSLVLWAFSSVGQFTSNGYQYNWLFGHDFLNKSVNSVALSFGVPSPHYFFSGEILRYYILGYSIPAVLYSIFESRTFIHTIMIAYSIVISTSFIFVFYSCLKTWFEQKVALILLFISFLAYSYCGIGYLFKDSLLGLGTPNALLEYTWISHLFYRFFLVEPQTVLGLMLFMTLVSLEAKHPNPSNMAQPVFIGAFLGILAGIEPSLALLLALALGCACVYRTIRGEIPFSGLVRLGMAYGLPVVLIYGGYLSMGLYATSGSDGGLALRFNPTWALLLPAASLVSYGPAALLGIGGLIAGYGNHRERLLILWLGVVTVLFMLGVTHENEVVFGFIKGEKVLFLVLLVLSGVFLQWGLNGSARKRLIVMFMLILIGMPALLTPWVDFYRITHGKDVGVVHVPLQDMKACEWIRKNIPKEAVVQSHPQYPGTKYSYSLIANFALRRMAVGEWKVSGVKQDQGVEGVARRYDAITNRLFGSDSPKEAHDTSREYGIGYIYVGPLEEKLYPYEAMAKWELGKAYFYKVYDQAGVRIFKVL